MEEWLSTSLAGSDQWRKGDFSHGDPGVDSMPEEVPSPILSQKVALYNLKPTPPARYIKG
ncbi:MAG: hypothetical protein DWQ02_05490 [Bacteroidetes bacterium]|nr:MAG: hypothetical protein DWQ02_05490 [Bacteroidota bacterium]